MLVEHWVWSLVLPGISLRTAGTRPLTPWMCFKKQKLILLLSTKICDLHTTKESLRKKSKEEKSKEKKPHLFITIEWSWKRIRVPNRKRLYVAFMSSGSALNHFILEGSQEHWTLLKAALRFLSILNRTKEIYTLTL